MITSWQLVLRSLRYYWRTNVAVALGVVAATAVLTGALLVGDSVRESLRRLTLERLGRIDEVLVTDRFFRAELAAELASDAAVHERLGAVEPAILLPSATVETTEKPAARAGQVLVVGADVSFWQLGFGGRAPERHPGRDEVVLNEPLARDLGVQVGDTVALRLPDASQIPADSTLGQKSGRIESLPRLEVIDILPAEGLGRFSLQPNQSLPKNAYVARSELAQALEEEDRINAILVGGRGDEPSPADHEALAAAFAPTLDDLGLSLERIQQRFPADSEAADALIFDYYSLTTDRMILDPALAEAALAALASYQAQPVLTYLATAIRKQPADPNAELSRPDGVPYSTITAIESSPHFPLLPEGQSLADDEIVLNRWTAEQLGAEVGDAITVTFFQPETIHGEHVESEAQFTLRAIVPLTEPASPYRRNRDAVFQQAPTLFNDPNLTPVVEGITDQESIEDWNAPFPFDIRRMQAADDEYWENHRTTPKAFVNLVAGQMLWGSRFGSVTSLRVPAQAEVTREQLEQLLLEALRRPSVLSGLGMTFTPVKAEGLQASSGTTPFDALFLGLSFFIILAAVLLVALMFRLGVDRRASQLGILGAVGLTSRQTTGQLITEGALLSALASIAGVGIGIGYAALMIVGLKTWWVGAIASPFLNFHMRWPSLAIGYFSGTVICIATIYWSARRLRRLSARQLLAGQTNRSRFAARSHRRAISWSAAGLLLVAVGSSAYATQLSAEAQAGAFVGGGAALLAALLVLLWNRMQAGSSTRGIRSLWSLSMSNAARNPTRSVLTIGLVAAATFLIVAMGAFRLNATLEGSGGFRLLARSSTPIYADLNQDDVRRDLLGDQAELLADVPILSFRVKPGDDASCRNLYKVSRPQVFGVPRDVAAYFDAPRSSTSFSWAGHAEVEEGAADNPWHLLAGPAEGDAVPVIVDKNTAMYSLHWYGGVGSEQTVTYEGGRTVRFRVVGLLSNSVLQGALLIGEDHFRRVFPEISGYQYFLIGAPAERQDQVRDTLEQALSDQGLDVVSAREVLDDLLAVQNTYLSTFQSLGALGLLLGTFGLATVQLRSVLERRGELALLRAEGFPRRRIGTLVMLENTALLLGGLAVGVLAALCAVVPYMILGGASVPLGTTLAMLATVLAIGTLAGLAAVRTSVRLPLVASLRSE